MTKRTRNRFAVIPASSFKKGLEPQQIALLAAFSLLNDDDGFIQANYSEIAGMMNRSKAWITGNLKKLVAAGAVRQHEKGVFSIVNDEEFVHSAEQDPLVRTNLVSNNIYNNNIYTPVQRAKRKVPLPEDFAPDEKDQEYVLGKCPNLSSTDITLETEKFKSHALANDRRCVRWGQAWRAWMINSETYRAGKTSKRPTPNDHFEQLFEAAERAEQILGSGLDDN